MLLEKASPDILNIFLQYSGRVGGDRSHSDSSVCSTYALHL